MLRSVSPGKLFFPIPDNLLGLGEGFLVNDGFVSAFRIVHRKLTLVNQKLFLNVVVHILLLKKSVTDVLFVCENLRNPAGCPLVSENREDSSLV